MIHEVIYFQALSFQGHIDSQRRFATAQLQETIVDIIAFGLVVVIIFYNNLKLKKKPFSIKQYGQ